MEKIYSYRSGKMKFILIMNHGQRKVAEYKMRGY